MHINCSKEEYTLEITFYRKLANKVSDAVIGNQEYSEADAKRIRYGLVCIFSDLYKFILFLIVFSIFSLTLEFLIAFIGMLILRPFLAGFHAKTELACIFMSFTTMLISIVVGDMNILPSYLQIILIILLPIIGVIVAPVRLKKVEKSKTGVLKLLAGITTIVLLFIDFYLFSSQILLISVILIYLLTLYQMLKNHILQQKIIKFEKN